MKHRLSSFFISLTPPISPRVFTGLWGLFFRKENEPMYLLKHNATVKTTGPISRQEE